MKRKRRFMAKLKLVELVFRAWKYFRTGYSTYLTFFVGFFTFVSTTYYLAIKSVPFLQKIFPHFYIFVIFGILMFVPLSILLGWLHMKGTLAYPTEIAISIESNPYTYKIMPGKEAEIQRPYQELVLRMLKKILEKEGMLSDEEKKELEEVLNKIERLRKGEIVGKPRQRRIMSLSKR